jgi:DNA-directed RNA polymerase specialized sigma24 family protein
VAQPRPLPGRGLDHDEARRANKRQAELTSLTLSGLAEIALPVDPDVIAVHESLLALEAVDPRAARIVELRFFGGLEVDEIAEQTGLSPATVKRDWSLAKAWLRRDLAGGG